jgi:nucleotide-binding universal stress UspA family protein
MDDSLTKILLATDGSEDAALASRAAADLASKTGAEMHVVHAWHSVPSTRMEAYIRSHLEQEAKELLAAQVERLEEEAGRSVAGEHLEEGMAVDEILDVAGEVGPDLLIMGSRGHGLVKRLVMGSVSEGVVHHAPCPILILRGGEEGWPPERVIFGDDGSQTARKAGDLAARIGRLCGAKGLILHAYPELPEMDLEGRRSNARLVDDDLRRAERALQERAAELENSLGTHPKIQLAVGDAAASLLEATGEGMAAKTLIAVGSRGLGMVRRARLGSVSTKVLRAARGPVLIHPQPHEAGKSM